MARKLREMKMPKKEAELMVEEDLNLEELELPEDELEEDIAEEDIEEESPLLEISDEDLIAEIKKRGLSLEEDIEEEGDISEEEDELELEEV